MVRFSSLLLVMSLMLFSAGPLHASSEGYELYIAEGIQLINRGNLKDAVVLLRKAMKLSPRNPEAAYYAGVACSREGRYEEAEALFLKTLRLDETYTSAYIELGRIYYETSRCDDLERVVSRLAEVSNDLVSKGEAADLVEGCRRKAEEGPYRLDVYTGIQYDSNVILEPSNPPVSAARKSDARAVAYLTSSAVLLERGIVRIKGGYNFYQSLHMDLGDFDVRYNKIAPVAELDLSDALSSSVGYSLEYTLLGGGLYSRFHTYYATLTLKERGGYSTEGVYEYAALKYWDSDLFRTNSIRSGFRNRLGIRQRFRLRRLTGEVYYFSDFNRADAGYWSFNGQVVGAGVFYRVMHPKVTRPLYLSLTSEYNERRYRDDYPGLGKRRLDRLQQYSLRFTYRISRRLSASITESYTVNDSNLGIFDYKRSITGVFLTVNIL